MFRFGIKNYYVHFIIGLLISIYIPALVGKISNRIIYTNFFFYPLKTIQILKEKNNII